jgi:hypothetical protein
MNNHKSKVISNESGNVRLTGNEKRFNELRSKFYETLEYAENFGEKAILEVKPQYTEFLKKMNRSQFLVPKHQERQAVKRDMYDMILNDFVSHKVITDDHKRELVLNLKSELKENLEKLAGSEENSNLQELLKEKILGYKFSQK